MISCLRFGHDGAGTKQRLNTGHIAMWEANALESWLRALTPRHVDVSLEFRAGSFVLKQTGKDHDENNFWLIVYLYNKSYNKG